MSGPDTLELNSVTQLRIDIGELKGILNTTVVTQGSQIADLANKQEIQRRDLTSVASNLTEKINTVSNAGSTNTENIKNLREDLKKVEEKQNSSFGKIFMALAAVLSFLSLIWNVVGGKV
jgi:hypothetical protein